MSRGWALAVPLSSLAAVARLRRFRSLGVCPQEEMLWLRGQDQDEALARELRLIPGGAAYWVLEDGQLVPRDALVPRGYLPEGPWHLLSEWLEIAWPAARDVQIAPVPFELSLVPSAIVSEPALLETPLSQWCGYAATAPQWRIDRWSYAMQSGPLAPRVESGQPLAEQVAHIKTGLPLAERVAHNGRVMVRGLPLPPLPGTRWVVSEGIAVPAGFAWSPPVEAAVVRQVLELDDSDLALLQPAGGWERIAAGDWVKATRSSVRRTREVLGP